MPLSILITLIKGKRLVLKMLARCYSLIKSFNNNLGFINLDTKSSIDEKLKINLLKFFYESYFFQIRCG